MNDIIKSEKESHIGKKMLTHTYNRQLVSRTPYKSIEKWAKGSNRHFPKEKVAN